LVESFALARKRFGLPHVLVVTGQEVPGSRERDFAILRQAVRAHHVEDAVTYTGATTDDDLAALFSAADALFLPSLMEGFGLPVVEAFACGTAVVCSRAGALPEVAGEAAEYVDPLDVDGMSAALGRVLTDDARRRIMVERGLKRAREFTWQRTARILCSALRLAMAG
jgi:alpha-1,3-rhamnosyl/mannosyltransferase